MEQDIQEKGRTEMQTKVIIIGGGPAGAMCSVFLTKAGIHHVLIDKETFPRDKVCGDAYGGKTISVLKKADPAWLDEIFKDERENLGSHGIVFSSPAGQSITLPFRPPGISYPFPAGFVAPRKTFDNYLFNKTPSQFAAVYTNAVVSKILKEPGGVTVLLSHGEKEYKISAPLIIGADGDKGIVRKNFLPQNLSAKASCVAVRAYYTGVTGFHENNFIELHFLREVLPGYLWVFPMSNGMANVGIGMFSDNIREKKINLREAMLHALATHPKFKDRFKDAVLTTKITGWGLPLWFKPLPVSGDHFMLTGDAAGLVDPFSGEGIGNAMFSGMKAALACEILLKENRFDAGFIREKYDKVLLKGIEDELKLSVWLQRLTKFPGLFNFFVRKTNKSKTLEELIMSFFAGADIRKKLVNPLFHLRVLRNK